MKLLFCIKALNNPGGGAERVMVDVVNGLHRRGHEVQVLTFERPRGRAFYPLDPAIGRLDLGMGSTTGKADVLSSLGRLTRLRRTVKDAAPDVVVGFMHSMFVLLAFALAGTGRRIIASEHIVPEHYRSRPLEAFLLRASVTQVEAITCVSEQVKAQYPSAIRRRMVVIPNPAFAPSGLRAQVDPGGSQPCLLLNVGRLVAQKDHETLIRAFARVADVCPRWRLRILGDGELRDDLGRLVQSLDMEERIEIKNSVADISREYLAAQGFVISSRYESFGLATAEALAHGLPAVGFADCAGTNVLIRTGENGILIEPGEDRVQSLAEGLQTLMQDDAGRRRLAEGSVAPVQFGLDTVLDAWTELLRERRDTR